MLKKKNMFGTQQANKHTCFLELCEDSIQPAFELHHELLSRYMPEVFRKDLCTIRVDATKPGT